MGWRCRSVACIEPFQTFPQPCCAHARRNQDRQGDIAIP